MNMAENLEILINNGWTEALKSWGSPSIPRIIAVKDESKLNSLGNIGNVLKEQFAFMQYPSFQVYANLMNIKKSFSDFARGYKTIVKHELGHRFCSYDMVTSLFLIRKAEKELIGCGFSKSDSKQFSGTVLNLFADTCINTALVYDKDEDIPWAYKELSASKKEPDALWHVYMNSYEQLWNKPILPEGSISEEEKKAGTEIFELFNQRNPLEKSRWEDAIGKYARILAPFLKKESPNSQANAQVMDKSASGSVPQGKELEGILDDVARKIADIGEDGLPKNENAVREFREFVEEYGLNAGTGDGNAAKAGIMFYEQLAKKYNIKFASKPFGNPRSSPFSLKKWSPSDPIGDLDVPQSVISSGVLIPGSTTQKWQSRVTQRKGGEHEAIPTLDIFLDSSGSMPNPLEVVSLPVLSGFVAARRAIRNGVRVVNYSQSYNALSRTTGLRDVYESLVIYHGGGTTFPVNELLENPADDPRLTLIITDTFLANIDETIAAIRKLRQRNKNNRVTIYAITNLPNYEDLNNAGAECIHGTTPNIFKHVLGKTERAYLR